MKIWKLNNDRSTLDIMAQITIGMGSLRFKEALTYEEKLGIFCSGRRVTPSTPVTLMRGPGDALLPVGLYSTGWVVAGDIALHPAMDHLKGRVQIFETISFTSSLDGYCILNFLNEDQMSSDCKSKLDFLKVENEYVYVGPKEKDALIHAGFPPGCFWETKN